jgi:type II secretion system protein G
MNKQGFTLIELLVAIAIVGLLASIAIFALGPARVKARDTRRVSDLNQLRKALELYVNDRNIYPPGNEISLGSASYACLNEAEGFTTKNCTYPYMAAVPADPQSGNYYLYTQTTSSYSISAVLEDKVNNLGPGTIHATPDGIGP